MKLLGSELLVEGLCMHQETLQSVSGLRRLPTESMSLAVLCLQSLVLSADDFYFQSRKSQSFQPLVPTYDLHGNADQQHVLFGGR